MITVGDIIRHKSVPAGVMDVVVLGVIPCDPGEQDHPAYEITDSDSGEPDIVCSYDFLKVR